MLYAEILARDGEQGKPAAVNPAALVAPMLERFIAEDREFVRMRQTMRVEKGM